MISSIFGQFQWSSGITFSSSSVFFENPKPAFPIFDFLCLYEVSGGSTGYDGAIIKLPCGTLTLSLSIMNHAAVRTEPHSAITTNRREVLQYQFHWAAPNDKRRPSSSYNCCLLSATSSVQHLHTKAIIELLTCTTGPVRTFAKLPFCPFAFALIITIKKINGLLNCTRNGLFMVRPTWKPNIS